MWTPFSIINEKIKKIKILPTRIFKLSICTLGIKKMVEIIKFSPQSYRPYSKYLANFLNTNIQLQSDLTSNRLCLHKLNNCMNAKFGNFNHIIYNT